MLRGKIVATKLPERRVEIIYVDHVACRSTDLDPITNAVRLAYQNINPTDEARNRRLQGEAKYQRDKTKGNDRCIPVLKEDRQYKKSDREPYDQSRDTFQVVLVNRIPHATDEVNVDDTLDCQANNDNGDCQDQLENQWVCSSKTR